jgi:arabinan endo-1,5-alpha-L-arabinosidase
MAACSTPNRVGDETDDFDVVGGVTYSNPVLNQNFADPTVTVAPDGSFYVYGTQTMIEGRSYNIQVARSTDLVDWTWLGDAFPEGVEWAAKGRDYWAPHVLYDADEETYFMYFSAHNDAKKGKCLAVATSNDPLGPFESTGDPLLCGNGYINIDPMAFDDPVTGKRLLYWGSGGQPIRVQELTENRLAFLPGTQPVPVIFPGPDAGYRNLIEGAWVRYRDGFYYIFYSGDNCCGNRANYAVMVARASDPFGPFERRGETDSAGGSVILEANSTWNAPGHNSLVQDSNGDDWIFYHAIERVQPRLSTGIPGVYWSRRVLLMDRIRYIAGWPTISGRQPSSVAEVPVVAVSNPH